MLKTVLIAILAGGAVVLGTQLWPSPAGHYPLLDHDHDEIMTSVTQGPPRRNVSLLFVGNNLIFVNDMPAMLVNIASSDPGNTTTLAVKAVTFPDADLARLRTEAGALSWAKAHRTDFVVLQPHSHWYNFHRSEEATLKMASDWRDALHPLGQTPVLFEVWSDGEGCEFYTNPAYHAFTRDPSVDARRSAARTAWMAHELGDVPVVPVGKAFERARGIQGAPDLYRADRHHPSTAGTFLAALVFYRYITGRNGAEVTYRPADVSAAAAAAIMVASAD